MNIAKRAIILTTALLITTSFCAEADITEQKKQAFLNAGLVDYDIESLIEVGTTPEEVLLFAQDAPTISPDIIYYYTHFNITPGVAAMFHPRVISKPFFIADILEAGLTPQTANSYIEAGVYRARSIIAYVKHGIPPNLADSLNKNGLYIATDTEQRDFHETFEKGLTTKDLPRYIGLARTPFELKKLYSSKVPTAFIHEAMSKNITLSDATSLYFHGIDLDTYPSLISDQPTCSVYPANHLEFEYIGNLAGYQSKKEPIPLPKDLFSQLNSIHVYNSMNLFSTDDQAEIFKYVENIANYVKKPTIYNLLYLTAHIVSQKLHYETVDEGELAMTFPEECSIAEYWRREIGDCDKYTVLGMVVFAQLKQLFPDVLANVYLTRALFSPYKTHAWNTVVIAEEDRLIFSYIDITNFDNDADTPNSDYRDFLEQKELAYKNPFRDRNEALGAMTTKYFNHQYFLTEYDKYFCKPTH
ncbi:MULTISPECIES: hypothetical protein [unclassified Endozoicomonas]|uniref:hypothetical protein n=1 Tax=unclassified Endozoicomonas TaxID=2644528 RepID=UPI003BAE9126